jgi:hypothetical protein
MAASTYDEALRRLLAHEGGYSNHPSDPGGPTNFGITLTDYRRYIKPDATAADVRAMSVDQAKAIYRKRYWDAQRCDDLPAGVDYSVFDYGVNSGIGRSGKVLRRVVGLPADTNAVTDQVLAYARARDPKVLVAAIEAEIDARRQASAIIIAEQGRWYTAIIRPLLALPIIIYLWKVIVWDKVLGLGTTDPITGMIADWTGMILAAYVGGRSIEKVARILRR